METSLIHDPMSVAAFLAFIVGGIFWLSRREGLEKLFEYVPPVIFCYFVPMVATTAGITPADSPVYGWLTRYLLP